MFMSCGDALYDLFVGRDESVDHPGKEATGGVSERAHQSESGAAASAVQVSGDVGGSPMNVAAGLARLGHHSRYFTKLSSDVFGRRMRGYFSVNNIDITASIESSLNTTLAIVEKQSDGSARYVFYTDNTADVSINPEELPPTLDAAIKVLHFGSYSTAVEPTGSSLARLAARETGRCLISYDPNLRPSIEPDIDKWREVFANYATHANLIKASDEDIATLLGPGHEEQFVADCFSHGAQLVFVTRGADGASGYKPDGQQLRCNGISVDVRDTVGAGDTFQAVVLHWLASQGHVGDGDIAGDVDLQACMNLAIRAASITCTRRGADLPTLQDLQ